MSNDSIRDLPVFQKAQEVVRLTIAVAGALRKREDSPTEPGMLIEFAGTLGAKIRGAEAVPFYTLKLENAFEIKIAARYLKAQIGMIRSLEMIETEYADLVLDAIEAFRIEFLAWVNSFDPSHDSQDEWWFSC